MLQVRDRLAIIAFNFIARVKGYSFKKANAQQNYSDIDKMYSDEGFSFPSGLQEKVNAYKPGTINFVAYYKNMPVGMVRLANPKVINRPYELYGVDAAGEHYEIQSLVVKKEYREGSQFVMLGLFKAMYEYSVRHDISSWNSCGAKNVYLTMKRFCKKIEVQPVDFAAINHPLTQYLYNNNIIETYFTMEVASFEPWNILKRFMKQLMKKKEIADMFKTKRPVYAYINYRRK